MCNRSIFSARLHGAFCGWQGLAGTIGGSLTALDQPNSFCSARPDATTRALVWLSPCAARLLLVRPVRVGPGNGIALGGTESPASPNPLNPWPTLSRKWTVGASERRHAPSFSASPNREDRSGRPENYSRYTRAGSDNADGRGRGRRRASRRLLVVVCLPLFGPHPERGRAQGETWWWSWRRLYLHLAAAVTVLLDGESLFLGPGLQVPGRRPAFARQRTEKRPQQLPHVFSPWLFLVLCVCGVQWDVVSNLGRPL